MSFPIAFKLRFLTANFLHFIIAADSPQGPEVVLSDYVIDYNRLNVDQRVLMEHEVDGYDFRYVYGLDLVNVKVTSEGSDWWGQSIKQCIYSNYTHTDRLGSVVNMSDQFGRVPTRIDYDDWGRVTAYDSITVDGGFRILLPEITYAGYQYDDILDQFYAKARMYDAGDRRFTSVDLLKGNVMKPLSLVKYIYANDNPLSYIDLLGLKAKTLKVNGLYILEGKWIEGNSGAFYVEVGELGRATQASSWGYQDAGYDYDLSTVEEYYHPRRGFINYWQEAYEFISSEYGNYAYFNSWTVERESADIGFINASDEYYISLTDFGKFRDITVSHGVRFVGFGIQVEVSRSIRGVVSGTVGCELVFYTDDGVRNNDEGQLAGHEWYEPYCYLYGGLSGSTGVKESLSDVLTALMQNPGALTDVAQISDSVPKDWGISIAVFAIIGNESFNMPEDYRGPFDSVSGTYHHVKGYVAVCGSCTAIGLGLSSEFASCGYSKTAYDLLGDGDIFTTDGSEVWKALAEAARKIAEAVPVW